ncbi:MAG TPA: hypothetical protein VFU15_00260 [Bacteroidia bacterium]|nr:hypothetical protein [Bacteroidia bacterium]
MRKVVNRISFYTLLAISCIFVYVEIREIRNNDRLISGSGPISWDSYGYYLHLPATVIHHDPGITDRSWLDSLNAKYQQGRPWYQALPGVKGRMVNVYTVGPPVVWLPFFLAGHACAKLFGYPTDGLSPPYQYAMIIAGLFYALLGLTLLRKLLLKYVNDRITAIVLAVIALGTNLYHYSVYSNTMPHILIFPFGVMIILLTISWHENPSKLKALGLGALVGLVTIIRPSELVWILVPVFWNVVSIKTAFAKIGFAFRHFTHVLIAGITLGCVLMLQMAYWKFTVNHWFSNNHSEGFDLFHPFVWQTLFSYKKGWLLYTPVMLFAIAGFWTLFRKKRELFVPLFIFFLANVYAISAWECWWYAGSFGQRPFVSSYGLMAVPLAFFLQEISVMRVMKWVAGFFIAAFSFLNQFQNWQLEQSILHYELMTKTYYWKIFGRTQDDPSLKKYLEIDRHALPPLEQVKDDYIEKTIYFSNYENYTPVNGELVCDTFGLSGTHSLCLDADHIYGVMVKMPYNKITDKDHLRIKMEADVFIPPGSEDGNLNFTGCMTSDREKDYGYVSFSAQSLGATPGSWTHVTAWYVTPFILHRSDVLAIVVWNQGGKKVFLDNMKTTAYEPKVSY